MGLADFRQDLQEVQSAGAELEAGQYTQGTKHGFMFRNLNCPLNDCSGTEYLLQDTSLEVDILRGGSFAFTSALPKYV